jgi:uncharacterized protein (TIGR02452 family)
MDRIQRLATAQDTLAVIEKGYYTTEEGKKIEIAAYQKYATDNTILYKSEELGRLLETPQPPPQYSTVFEVKNETSLNAVHRLIDEGFEDVLCLNFASAKNPGGGFLNGAVAQEESLALVTGLYGCQLKADDYYQSHRLLKTCLYTDQMIYSPKVPIFRTDNGTYLETTRTVTFITSAAVNAGVVKRQELNNVEKIEPYMRKRIAKMLALSAHYKHEALVLGAWGCGVFQNDPNDIAQWFKEALEGEFKGVFKKIVFAVYAQNPRFIEPFEANFGRDTEGVRCHNS